MRIQQIAIHKESTTDYSRNEFVQLVVAIFFPLGVLPPLRMSACKERAIRNKRQNHATLRFPPGRLG